MLTLASKVTPQEVAEVMLAIEEKDKISTSAIGQAGLNDHQEDISIVGGSCLEVSAGQVRDVSMHNNPGPYGRVGNNISNVAEFYEEIFGLIKQGSGKT